MSLLTQEIIFRDAADSESFTINDQESYRSNWRVEPFYYIKVASADGLYGADLISESHSIPHAIGDKSWDTFRKGKGITLSGEITGRTILDMHAAVRYLQEMFWDTSLRKLMWNEYDGTEVYLLCRVLNDLSVAQTFDSLNPKWAWTVGLRADDPRQRKESDDSLFYDWMT